MDFITKRIAIVALAAVLICGATALSDDSIPLEKAPPAVQAAVKKVVGSNKFISLDSDVENGKTVYEVDAEGKNASYSVHMSETGEILGISLDIPIEIVPPAVTDAAHKAYPGAELKEPEIRTEKGQMLYKLELNVGKVKHELLIDASGKVSADETDNEGADDDAKKP